MGAGGGFICGWIIATLLVLIGYCTKERYFGGAGSAGANQRLPTPMPTVSGGSGQLPPGWEKATDPDKGTYYYNKSTGATSWSPP